MELTEILVRRRMTRNFRPDRLPGPVVDEILAGALSAPSAGNTQGREFVVLDGPAETGPFWRTVTDERWRTGSRRYRGLSAAPVVVLVFSDPGAYVDRYGEPDKVRADGSEVEWVIPYWHVDAAFSALLILLGATGRGLGAAFLGNFRGEDALKALLGVPDRLRWLGAVLLGEKDRPDPPSSSVMRTKRTLADSVHRGRW